MENVKNIKPNYIYADAEEKFVKGVVLYYTEESVERVTGQSGAEGNPDIVDNFHPLYYDVALTQPVKAAELKDLFKKGQILIDDCLGYEEAKDYMYFVPNYMVTLQSREVCLTASYRFGSLWGNPMFISDPNEFKEVEENTEEVTE